MSQYVKALIERDFLYLREAKTVFAGDGKCFKYEFDCSSARIPAFAAVSPNLASGPKYSAVSLRSSLSYKPCL